MVISAGKRKFPDSPQPEPQSSKRGGSGLRSSTRKKLFSPSPPPPHHRATLTASAKRKFPDSLQPEPESFERGGAGSRSSTRKKPFSQSPPHHRATLTASAKRKLQDSPPPEPESGGSGSSSWKNKNSTSSQPFSLANSISAESPPPIHRATVSPLPPIPPKTSSLPPADNGKGVTTTPLSRESSSGRGSHIGRGNVQLALIRTDPQKDRMSTDTWLSFQTPAMPVVKFPIYPDTFKNRWELFGPNVDGLMIYDLVTHNRGFLCLECNWGQPLSAHIKKIINGNQFLLLYVKHGRALMPSEPARQLIRALIKGLVIYLRIYKWHGDLGNVDYYTIVNLGADFLGECVVTIHPPLVGRLENIGTDVQMQQRDMSAFKSFIFGTVMPRLDTRVVEFENRKFRASYSPEAIDFVNHFVIGEQSENLIGLGKLYNHPFLWDTERKRNFVLRITGLNEINSFCERPRPSQASVASSSRASTSRSTTVRDRRLLPGDRWYRYTQIEKAIEMQLDPCAGTLASKHELERARVAGVVANEVGWQDIVQSLGRDHPFYKFLFDGNRRYGRSSVEFTRYITNLTKHYAKFTNADSWCGMIRRSDRKYISGLDEKLWLLREFITIQLSTHFPLYVVNLQKIMEGLGMRGI